MEEQRKYPESTGNFTGLFTELAAAGKTISREVNMAGLLNQIGTTGHKNIQGEEVQKLDEFADSTIIRTMEHSGLIAAMASEENDDIVTIPDELPKGSYLLLFDPLDGSSNIDVNVCVGTIFSILKLDTSSDNVTTEDFLRPGTEQVSAGYIIYGSSTMLVYTTGHGVHGFTLDPSVGEFLLSHEDIKTPSKGKIYSVNEGNTSKWHDGAKNYIEKVKSKGYTSRYIGSLVADFHRNLLKGGIFLYPEDSKNKNGKLRLMYEANPLAFIIEEAGGAASTGSERIMEITPSGLHQRVPLIIGSKKDVQEAVECWEK
jgi:fructose-1,6-bisphosphatase I